MTTQPLARYGAVDGALASGLITASYTTSRDTTGVTLACTVPKRP